MAHLVFIVSSRPVFCRVTMSSSRPEVPLSDSDNTPRHEDTMRYQDAPAPPGAGATQTATASRQVCSVAAGIRKSQPSSSGNLKTVFLLNSPPLRAQIRQAPSRRNDVPGRVFRSNNRTSETRQTARRHRHARMAASPRHYAHSNPAASVGGVRGASDAHAQRAR